MNSGGSLRRFSTENAKVHREIGARVYSSEPAGAQYLKGEKMQSSKATMEMMDIPLKERKYHDGKKELSVGVWRANPVEIICRTLRDELNQPGSNIKFRKHLGMDTLFITGGLDKAAHGVAFSYLLCTRQEANNSSKRRRPSAYIERPAVESTNNLLKLFGPMRKDITALKENSCALIMDGGTKREKHCIILHCDEQSKPNLDHQWSERNNIDIKVRLTPLRDQ